MDTEDEPAETAERWGRPEAPWEWAETPPRPSVARTYGVVIVLLIGLIWLRASGVVASGTSAGPPLGGPESVNSYEFLDLQDDGVTPVTYSSCSPIRLVVNTRTMPPGAEGVVEEAVAEIAAITGLEMIVDGETSERPSNRRNIYAPVLVAWSDVEEYPALVDGVAGVGRSISTRVGVDSSVELYVSGQIGLNGPSVAAFISDDDGRDLARAVVMHELGHVLGLDHTDDPSQLMHDDNLGVTAPQAGDRAGLARLGQGPCVSDY